MEKVNILDAVDTLKSALSKIEGFDIEGIQLSDRVLDNRIITLEGYLRFLDREGIPKLERIRDLLPDQLYTLVEGGKND